MPGEGPALPSVSLWELPAFYRRLKAAVVELENAWEDGRLCSALVDVDVASNLSQAVLRSYERLVDVDDLRHSSFRRDSIHAVLNPVKELLAPPKVWFEVAPLHELPIPMPIPTLQELPRTTGTETAPPGAEADRAEGDPAPSDAHGAEASTAADTDEDTDEERGHPPSPPFRVLGPTGEMHMRLHQVVSARFWGMGFEFGSPYDEQLFVNTLLREVLERLSVDLNDLMHIQRWYRSRPRDGQQPIIVPDPSGRRYEQLMLDILNEEQRCARRARLAEDFLEKTDVRVRVSGVRRRRGARVQITQTTHPDYLAQKRASIRHVNEYVILSPLPLAEAMMEPAIGGSLTAAEQAALWRAIPNPPTTVSELAQAIKRIFLTSMEEPILHPMGPMWKIPRPIRALVRAFVGEESRRTTAEMRSRHAHAERGGKRPRSK